MGLGVYGLVRRATDFVALPAYTHFFLDPAVGREYGIGLREKVKLMKRVHRNATRITSATGWLEQLILVARVLSLPRELEGDVVECGCFKGASTASLSLACELTGRRLVVCDSFEGLPEIAAEDVVHVSLHAGLYETYAKGEYKGALDEVRGNVERYGALGVCEFVKGYFEHTLHTLERPIAMAFLDVDLHASLRTCLIRLWPLLREQGYLYTHEAGQLDYVSLFFDRDFWREHFGCNPPGLIGAGSGLPAGVGGGTSVGYTIKLPQVEAAQQPLLKHFCGDPTKR